MKIRFQSLYGLAIISSFLCLYTSKVFSVGFLTDNKVACAPGCFCIYDGTYPDRFDTKNICGYGVSQKESCENTDKGYIKIANVLLACDRNTSIQATYHFDEFSELYTGSTGMYGIIGDELVVMPSDRFGDIGIYQCPSSYPNSASGAKTLFECYKYENGKKIYYKNDSYENCNDAIKNLSAHLQIALDKVNKTAQYLQNNVNVQTVIPNNILETEKAIINAGVSDSLIRNKDNKITDTKSKTFNSNIEKNNGLKTQKTTAGKPLRSSSNMYMNGDLEAVKKMISAGI